MARFLTILAQLPLAVLSPLAAFASLACLWIVDLTWLAFGRRAPLRDSRPDTSAATVVIPNWNGRDLLEKYLPSVVQALAADARNEIIVVDNGSTDDSTSYVRERFPQVRLLALPKNLGFGGGSNAGFLEARNDIVVLLNSDMRVSADFLQPLLDGFTDERVFAVSCQIFFSDPDRMREETGLTQAWWSQGALRVRHRDDPVIADLFPCFYGGGGSCAFDRRKFLELGGFDELLRPFYLEDTDIGYRAWKRGWKVLYQPKSRVWHEHRGTIGKTFTRSFIDRAVKKNFILFAWKNIHEPLRLGAHFVYTVLNSTVSLLFGDSPERPNLAGFFRAFLQLPGAMRARWRDRGLAVIDDREAFRRPLGGYFRDRFAEIPPNPSRLSVLFLSPYPVCPPTHGGGVFMYQTLRRLGPLADVHLIALVDAPWEIEAHQELAPFLASMEFLLRLEGQPRGSGSLIPYAVREFTNPDLEWLIHRQIHTKKIDVVQIEYTNMGQYAGPTHQIPFLLFEHDVYFQSIARGLRTASLSLGWMRAFLEYMRALRYELRMLPRMDRIQTCTAENKEYLLGFLPQLRERIDDHVRAGIDTERYHFAVNGRVPGTLLFLGSFRHLPNLEALNWFLLNVMPRVLAEEPAARLIVVGSDPPPAHTLPNYGTSVELVGFVEDVREALARYSVFVCPILSGSGVRVKLLEAFAAGIPVVSTRLGAEGLGSLDGELCALGDSPEEFAARTVALLRDPGKAAGMAERAHGYVVACRDMTVMTSELERTYRLALAAKRAAIAP
jgi:O-antigen biosynthesis protein